MSLRAAGLTLGYDGPPVVSGVALEVPRGSVVGLTGPSGTGKTTLARAMCGLIAPRAGTVTLDGVPLPTRRGRLTGRVVMLFQSPRRSASPRLRLGQLIAEPLIVGARAQRPGAHADVEARARQVAAQVGLTDDLLDRLPAEVSDGQLQRAALARALTGRPAYLICDEATAMLDAGTTAALVAVIGEHVADGLGVLTVAHDHRLLRAWADVTYDIADITGTGGLLPAPAGTGVEPTALRRRGRRPRVG